MDALFQGATMLIRGVDGDLQRLDMVSWQTRSFGQKMDATPGL